MKATAKIHSEITYGNSVDYNNLDEWQRKSHPWTVLLRYRGRQMKLNFWTGSMAGEPNTHDVVTCVTMDCSGFSNSRSFEDWASEYGYDTDSRKAEAIYKAVQIECRKFSQLMGDDYDSTIYMDEDELTAICS